MLKAAQKTKIAKVIKKSSINQNTTCQSRSITTHYQYDRALIGWDKRKDIMDTNISSVRNVGILRLNREHRYNLLTTNNINNVRRGIETLNLDDDVRLIYMTTEKGEHFCNGTDFRQIMYYKKENNYDQIAAYLTDVYSLQTQVAKLNKPMIVVAPGHSFNSGATLLAASALPATTLDAKLSFNEVCFGFVPHAGATYYLSRLPDEFGVFLALTGLPLVSGDAMEYKLVDTIIHNPQKLDQDLRDFLARLDQPYLNYSLKTNFLKDVPWLQHLRLKHQEIRSRQDAAQAERVKRSRTLEVGEQFIEPRDRRPSLSADADFKYKQLLERYNAIHHPNQETGYFDYDDYAYQNHFEYILGPIKSRIGDPNQKNAKTFMKYGQEIHRCFFSETVEEIMNNLRREDTPFTRLCLQSMQRNSMLSMKLALKMIRKAVNLDYKGAMELEINTALNKIQHSDFDLGVSEVLLKPGKHGTSPAFSRDVSDELVESFFEINPHSKDVKLDIVENPMLPTRFYFEKHSDQVRLWLNEESTTQPWVREFFDTELVEALRHTGIDIRDRALTQESARKQMKVIENLERKQETFNSRLRQLVNDDKLRTNYFDQIDKEVSKFQNDSSAFYKLVNELIYKVYEEGFMNKLQTIYTKSQEAHNLEKRRMFVRLKKFLFKSRILTYSIEAERAYKQAMSMPQKEIHLTEDWEKSYREMNHPDIERSFLWQLSKAVGKVNIAPLQLAQQYITNPEMRKQMTLYTFDKEELIKLRKDILENPAKYERMLVKGGIHGGSGLFEPKDRQYRQLIKAEEYEYWFRAVNDGRTPFDSLPYYKDYLYYKEFADNVENNIVDTLKMTVSRLISDFEDNENVANKVVEFEQLSDKESKRAALDRLMLILGQPDKDHTSYYDSSSKNKVPRMKTTDKPVSLTELQENNKDIKRTLRVLLEQDEQLKALFQSSRQSSENSLVHLFREEMLLQFASLMELVLLKKYQGVPVDKTALEERYQELTNTKHVSNNAAKQQQHSLRVIDAYLSHENFHNFVAEALHVAKPYFLKMMEARIEDEEMKVLKAVKSESCAYGILFYYLMNTIHPEARDHPVTQRLVNFNENRDQNELIAEIAPQMSNKYGFKQYIARMGHSRSDAKGRSVEEKEKLLQETTNEEYEQVNKYQQAFERQEKEWKEQTQKERQRQLKLPQDEEATGGTMPDLPQYNVNAYTPADLLSIMTLSDKADRIMDYIQENADLIQRHMQKHDWMHVIGMSITEYGLDMQANFRDCLPPEQYQQQDHHIDMQNVFQGNRNIQWSDVGGYAEYLKGFGEALEESARLLSIRDKRVGTQSTLEFFASNMDTSPQDAQLQLDQDRVFQILTGTNQQTQNQLLPKKANKEEKYSYGYVQRGQDRLRQEYLDFKKLQEKVSRTNELKHSIQALSSRATGDVKELVSHILEGKSHYYNLEKLQKLLLTQKYSEIDVDQLLDKEALIQDVSSGKLLADFTKNYGNTRVDVLTLAEIKAAVMANESSLLGLDDKLKRYIGIVVDFITKQLRHVPNSRRKQITISQFLTKFNHVDMTSLQTVADNILTKSIEDTLGRQAKLFVQSQGVIDGNGEPAIVEWEYAGVNTHPLHNKTIDRNRNSAKTSQQTKKNESSSSQNEIKIDGLLKQTSQNRDNAQTGPKAVVYANPITGILEVASERDFEMKELQRDAKASVIIKEDFEPTRAYFENMVLESYSDPEFNEEKLIQIFTQYMELRIKECMLRDGFKAKVNGNNGHLYLKALKEEVMEELNINQPSRRDDFVYENLVKDVDFRFVMEGKYNTTPINNLDAMGYDNFEERLQAQSSQSDQSAANQQSIDANRQLAHETFFDKLLADYFLQKRSQYVKTNGLIEDLNKQFGHKCAAFSEGHPRRTRDDKAMDPTKFPFEGRPNISYALLQQQIEKDEEPYLDPNNAAGLMELDTATAQILQNGMNGLSEALRTPLPQGVTDIPQYFTPFDVRRPAQQYVKDKLQEIISNIFDARRKIEKTLTRRELLAFDKNLTKYLVKDSLFPNLVSQIDADKNQLFQLQQLCDRAVEKKEDDFIQHAKFRNDQARENNKIKNEDALYKWLAYTGMLDKDRRTHEKEDMRTGMIALGVHSFENFYEAELLEDVNKPARPIIPEEYEPKTNFERLVDSKKTFRTLKERQENYFQEFKIYKQNKKETLDRNEMFYVLEQFFAAAKSKPDPSDKAQEAIRDYFGDTENTYFFDKNKIR